MLFKLSSRFKLLIILKAKELLVLLRARDIHRRLYR